MIPIKTIFENGTFDRIISSNVNNLIFVYSLSRDIFEEKLKSKYQIQPIVVRNYMKDNITLEVKSFIMEGKEIFLSYSPIHGNIKDSQRRPALKKAIELDLK